jgi:ankyrin repeat protein
MAAEGEDEEDDYDLLLCSRFVTALELDDDVDAAPIELLLNLCDAYTGEAGHLLLHPHDPLARAVFGGSSENEDNDEAVMRRDRKRIEFFRCLLKARPDLRLLQSPESGITLLHLALYQFASLPLIQLLACPPLMSYQDSSGRTPLYLACYRSQMGVKALLFELDPTAAAMVDNDQQLPLHLACQQDPLDPIVDKLIKAYPEGLGHMHAKGVTPVLGAFWHQEQQQVREQEQHHRPRRYGKLELLMGWVEQYPESIKAFNSSNLETALACACRQVYRNFTLNDDDDNEDHDEDRIDNDNLRLCRLLIQEYPVALGITVSMTLASRQRPSLPYPVQIARHYGRTGPLVKELERATVMLVQAFVELVLHETFGTSASASSAESSSASMPSGGRHMRRLQRHTMDAIEQHCPWIDVRRYIVINSSNNDEDDHAGRGDSRSSSRSATAAVTPPRRIRPNANVLSSLALAELVVRKQEQQEVVPFPEALCASLFRNYDARFLLKTDAAFRNTLCALFRMNRTQQQQEDGPAASALRRSGMWHHDHDHDRPAEVLAAGSDDVTALFLRVREFVPSVSRAAKQGSPNRRLSAPPGGPGRGNSSNN